MIVNTIRKSSCKASCKTSLFFIMCIMQEPFSIHTWVKAYKIMPNGDPCCPNKNRQKVNFEYLGRQEQLGVTKLEKGQDGLGWVCPFIVKEEAFVVYTREFATMFCYCWHNIMTHWR